MTSLLKEFRETLKVIRESQISQAREARLIREEQQKMNTTLERLEI